MLITADWVLPVSRPPIQRGAVLIDGGRIVEVGEASRFSDVGDDWRFDFPNCVLMPGLVNAHSHLSLSALEGVLSPARFEDWLPRLVAAMRAWSRDDFAASAALGAHRSIRAGVTVVGDIAYGPESVQAAERAGLGGVFYWEVLGITADRLYAELERLGFPIAEGGRCGHRVRCGLSPHSVYGAGPGLLQAVHALATELGAPLAVHVAESRAESELLLDGTGPLVPTVGRLAPDFEVPHATPVTYLDRLGVLHGATVVHLCQTTPADVPRLAATVRGGVTCPRSNRFLSNCLPPVDRIISAGVPLGIGTDSTASNDDVDLMNEVRVLHEADPSLPARTLVEMATVMGAISLGLEDRFGMLEGGMQADLAVFRVGPTADPEGAVVRDAGAATAHAVMSAGVWRMISGKPIDSIERVESAAAAATARARAALAAN